MCEIYFTTDYGPSWYDYVNPFYSPTPSFQKSFPLHAICEKQCNAQALQQLDDATKTGLEMDLRNATGVQNALTLLYNNSTVTAEGLLIASVVEGAVAVKGFGNVSGGATTAENALVQAEKYLGKGYKEISPGVYRSADGTRQFRMTSSDLLDIKQGPHVHFESIGSNGKIIENSHVIITNP